MFSDRSLHHDNPTPLPDGVMADGEYHVVLRRAALDAETAHHTAERLRGMLQLLGMSSDYTVSLESAAGPDQVTPTEYMYDPESDPEIAAALIAQCKDVRVVGKIKTALEREGITHVRHLLMVGSDATGLVRQVNDIDGLRVAVASAQPEWTWTVGPMEPKDVVLLTESTDDVPAAALPAYAETSGSLGLSVGQLAGPRGQVLAFEQLLQTSASRNEASQRAAVLVAQASEYHKTFTLEREHIIQHGTRLPDEL